ncbi:hypothetical protein C8A03DRAFT_11951 [Achaetomium macrosporum]|uniref:PhoD-like phosphatase domain-containing protein n=1 Tax=Achaetomium macrosporum TaxID=79813 RepID=A0AAN7HE82_9PEZI|nr:hypothetical protein C8A03DRAFT_11951 [Achaetomium macrosporum]
MSTPYWGQLPTPKASQTRARRLSDDQGPPPERRQSLDVPAQGQSRANRVSVQTTKSDAPTESTQSPFASPTASSFYAQGLTPRPPSLPYGAGQYPPELLENRRRRRSRNQEQEEEYAAVTGPPPPAAPDVPRAPPSSSKYQPVSGAPPQRFSRASKKMETEEFYQPSASASREDDYPVPNRTRKTLQESAMPRPQRINTDPTFGRNSPLPNGRPRRASAAEQSLQRSARRPSTQSSAGRPKMFADDRSPLQRLELTLDSISKEDKRARVEAAERAARERAAANGSVRQSEKSPQQARFRERRPSVAAGDAPKTPITPARPTQGSAVHTAQNGPLSQNPPDLGRGQSTTAETSPRAAAPESRIPVPVQSSGIPQRNLSFRERAARNDIKLPSALDSPASKEASPAIGSNGRTPPRSGSNKLKKAPPNDGWPNRISDSDEIHGSGGVAGGPATPITPRAADLHAQPRFVPAARELEPVDHDDFGDEFMAYAPAGKLTKSPPGQRTAYQFLARIPTRTATTNGARQAVPQHGAHRDHEQHHSDGNGEQHHVSDLIYHARDKYQPGQGIFKPTAYLDEWKKATVGTLSGGLLDLEEVPPAVPEKNGPWWEPQQSRRRSDSMSSRPKKAEAYEGEYAETNGTRTPNQQAFYPSIGEVQSGDLHLLLSTSDLGGGLLREPQHLAPPSRRTRTRTKRWDGLPPTRFKPPLYLKCGPLLRFCGIRHERAPNRSAPNGGVVEREIWRGSIMIVTTDADSSYDIAPTLRLFAQPIELLPPPPREIKGDEPLAPEYVDPIAGHPKLGRKGETLYVRPVDHLQEGKDISRDETDDGLFEKSKSPPEVPLPEGMVDPPGSFAARRKRAEMDGEKVGKYKDIRGFRLHAERGYTFWRFNIEVELREKQQRIAYRINRGPSTGFWVPAKGQSMNIMFYSCNGFSLTVNPHDFSGPDPMWRDVLNTHQSQPFHVMIGGGDQIYNDRCMQDTKIFKDWLMIKNPLHKHNAPFTPEMQDELETFYLERYAMWFSQGLFSMANAQIPMVNMYDDHDIIDGFGSYPHHFMNSPVFSGLGNVAFKYYMLFQHQSIVHETEKSEPSWILGVQPGPYINELSRSLFMFLGAKVALLAVDARTERTRDEVIREDTWKKIMDRCYSEIDKGKVEHLLVLLGVPIAYPRLVWLENILTSRVMDPVKALAKMGMFGGLLNRFDGGVEVLDDLDDHWTAKNHKRERSIVVEDLQDLAADKSIRVTILSGDVHLAAIGQFYSNPKLGLAKHKDFRYIPNIISSAIVNTPPPDLLADVLNKRNKVHHFDKETDEDMIPIFAHGVDGKPRNNKHLLPHRNWCAIREYVPGHTPPSTPDRSASDVTPLGSPYGVADGDTGRRRSGSIFRRLSRARTTGPDVTPKDRSRPPISGGLLRSLSRRAGIASADEVGKPPQQPKPGFLTRSLSSSSVSGRFGGLFRRRSSSNRRDDGGINGVWGPDTDEDDPQDAAYHHHIGLRGGAMSADSNSPVLHAASGGYNSEFDHGDESYFSVVRQPPHPHHHHHPYAPTKPGDPPLTVTGGAAPPSTQQHQQHQQQQEKALPNPNPGAAAFHRTPTALTTKQRKRAGGAEDALAVDLRGALEVTLNVEISPRDPGGSTVPYRLVVPRLWYEDEGEEDDEGGQGGGEGEMMREGHGQGGGGGEGEMRKGGLRRLITGSLRRKRAGSDGIEGGHVPGPGAAGEM